MSAALNTHVWADLDRAARAQLLKRPASSRATELVEATQSIIDQVRVDGDAALSALTQKFDGVKITALRVPADELETAWQTLDADDQRALEHARANIERFHATQKQESPWVEVQTGVSCRQVRRPIDAVGLYVPGGSAPLPSALLMLATPAMLSDCPRIVVCSPPQSDGHIASVVLAAARLCGVTEVYSVGGAQAIAAMAYGTPSLPKVDKIFGPGNAFVTAAKMLAAQDPDGAACDMPAGPSEVLVMADDRADPDVVAADLLAQAEHGPDSQVLLFTDSATLAQHVARAIQIQLQQRSRRDTIEAALEHSRTIVFATLDEALAASNDYAPEHLILNTRNADELSERVTNAGSIFVGPWAAETFGDYCSGTNHVLPTYGFARAYSGVSLKDFCKFITVQRLSARGFDDLADTARRLARLEGLDAHEAAVTVRQTLRAQQQDSA
ncbi:MAG: histidinol dehydrogenase [Gammaproteobacteria bacterium]